jgi:hypothetical protein
MRSRFGSLIVVLALAGCAVEHGNRPPERADARAGPSPHGAPQGGAMGAMHQVFDRFRETVAPGVDRITLSVMLVPEKGRDAQRATLESVADAQRREDGSLAGIRVLGFLPPAQDHGDHPTGMRLIPFAILEWLPAGGWNALTAQSARAPHETRLTFVEDLPSHPKLPGSR